MDLRNSLPKIVTEKVPGPKSAEMLKIRKDNVTDAVDAFTGLRGKGRRRHGAGH